MYGDVEVVDLGAVVGIEGVDLSTVGGVDLVEVLDPAEAGEAAVVVEVSVGVGIGNLLGGVGGAWGDAGDDLGGEGTEVEAGEAVVVLAEFGAFAGSAELGADPEGVVVGEEHFGVVSVGDGDLVGDGIGGKGDGGEVSGEEAVGQELLAGDVEVIAVGDRGGCTSGHGDVDDEGVDVGIGGGDGEDVEGCELEGRDAGTDSAALRTTVEDEDVVAIDGEVGIHGAVKAGVFGVAGDGNDAIDGQVVGLAVDGAGRVGLIGVELDDAIEGVGVAHHGEGDGVAGVDDDLLYVREIEGVGTAKEVVVDDDLSDGGLGGVDAGEGGGHGDGGGLGGEGAGGTGGGFLTVVDDAYAAVGVGVDVALGLLGEGLDFAGVSGGVTGDGEGGDGVLDVAADVAAGIEELEATLGAVGGDGDHDAVGELAGRNGPVGEGVLGELVVVVARGVAGAEAEGDDREEESAEDADGERREGVFAGAGR